MENNGFLNLEVDLVDDMEDQKDKTLLSLDDDNLLLSEGGTCDDGRPSLRSPALLHSTTPVKGN